MSSSIAARIAAFERGEPLRTPDSPPSETTALPVPVPLPLPLPTIQRVASPPSPSVRGKPPPPLPPRKPSLASLKSNASSSAGGLTRVPSRVASDTLTVHGPHHTYPPTGTGTTKARHAPAASTSSFQSVSLEDGDGEADGEGDHESLDGSFESVPSSIPTSTSIPSSPASETLSLGSAAWKAPKLPQRPSPPVAPAVATVQPVVSRRPAPPPPIKTPKLGYPPMRAPSVASSSSSSLTDMRRPTPVPPAARARYDMLFDRNVAAVAAAKKTAKVPAPSRRADGWRGLSIDWTSIDNEDSGGPRRKSDDKPPRLRGTTVKIIWSWSKLPREKLKEIWDQVNPDHHDGLTRDAFANGMWRIDEELSRAAAAKARRTGRVVSSTGVTAARKPVPPLPARVMSR